MFRELYLAHNHTKSAQVACASLSGRHTSQWPQIKTTFLAFFFFQTQKWLFCFRPHFWAIEKKNKKNILKTKEVITEFNQLSRVIYYFTRLSAAKSNECITNYSKK